MQTSLQPVLADSVTSVPADASGRLLITGSHGGLYAAACALRLRAGAAVFSDAGRGREDAGIAGLDLLERFGVPAAAVSHTSARIGDACDLLARGRISAANRSAHARGVRAGDLLQDAWPRLAADVPAASGDVAICESERQLDCGAGPRVFLLDSNSLVGPQHRDAIVVTGSHGGLLGGRPATAIKHPVFAAFYNDAGVGIDEAGIARLPALDRQGIAGIAVDAANARIGDAMSTYRDGVASHVNRAAAAFGIAPAMRVTDIVEMLCAAWLSSRFTRDKHD